MRSKQQADKDITLPSLPKRGLPPIVNPIARTLILGTLPGEESLRRQQYYGHPQNHFWPVIASLARVSLPSDYPSRVALLRESGFALWDVLLAAERIGSLDSAIRNATPNDFASFFRANPRIGTIAFNGQKAHALFRQHVARNEQVWTSNFRMLILPSTSPAYVKPLGEKTELWRLALATDPVAPRAAKRSQNLRAK